jgi:putative transposase
VRSPSSRATHRNHVWSYDFLVDRTENGRQLKVLVVIDGFTRECLAAEVGRTFTARDVMLTLQYLFAVRGAPEARSQRQRSGVHCEGVATLVGTGIGTNALHPEGEPMGKRLRGELQQSAPGRTVGSGTVPKRPGSPLHFRRMAREYNHRRPHGGLQWQTPATYAAKLEIDGSGRSRPRRVLHLRSGLRPSLQRRTKHYPILSQTLVLKSGGPQAEVGCGGRQRTSTLALRLVEAYFNSIAS